MDSMSRCSSSERFPWSTGREEKERTLKPVHAALDYRVPKLTWLPPRRVLMSDRERGAGAATGTLFGVALSLPQLDRLVSLGTTRRPGDFRTLSDRGFALVHVTMAGVRTQRSG